MINSEEERALNISLRHPRPFPQGRNEVIQPDGLALELATTNRRDLLAADARRTRDDRSILKF